MYFKTPDNNQQMPDILLIAGGVGINPLWSILLELREQKIQNNHNGLPRNVTLLYSSGDFEELLFKVETKK